MTKYMKQMKGGCNQNHTIGKGKVNKVHAYFLSLSSTKCQLKERGKTRNKILVMSHLGEGEGKQRIIIKSLTSFLTCNVHGTLLYMRKNFLFGGQSSVTTRSKLAQSIWVLGSMSGTTVVVNTSFGEGSSFLINVSNVSCVSTVSCLITFKFGGGLEGKGGGESGIHRLIVRGLILIPCYIFFSETNSCFIYYAICTLIWLIRNSIIF